MNVVAGRQQTPTSVVEAPAAGDTTIGERKRENLRPSGIPNTTADARSLSPSTISIAICIGILITLFWWGSQNTKTGSNSHQTLFHDSARRFCGISVDLPPCVLCCFCPVCKWRTCEFAIEGAVTTYTGSWGIPLRTLSVGFLQRPQCLNAEWNDGSFVSGREPRVLPVAMAKMSCGCAPD